ncbi:hypothetical protein N9937_01955 [bacterium]|nr:hypothetical protein [bacterium]
MISWEAISSKKIDTTEALFPSDTIYSGALSASTEQQVTVPTGADFALFNATGDYYVNYDTTAAVPTGTISEAGGEINPVHRYVGETTTIHIISASDILVSITFYAK